MDTGRIKESLTVGMVRNVNNMQTWGHEDERNKKKTKRNRKNKK